MTCSRGLTEPAPTPRFVHSEQSNQPSNASALRQQPSKELQNALPQANTAAPPTQSWSKQAKPKQPNQPSNAMRGGMWNGRASRRTQGSITIQENKTSAGIGTTVEHPPRERIEPASIERGSKCVSAGGHSGPPLRGAGQRNQNQSNPTSQATRAH